MRRINILLTLLVIGVLGLQLASAQGPFTQVVNTPQGLEIAIQQLGTLTQNQDFTFNIHVYNNSNKGLPVTNSTANCTLHLSNSSGVQVLELRGVYQLGIALTNEWRFFVTKGNLTSLGDYALHIQCQSPGEGGFASFGFEVTRLGDQLSDSEITVYIISLVATLFFFLLFVYLSFYFPYENAKNEEGDIVKITKTKYLKIMSIFCSYTFFYMVFTIITGLSNNYIFFEGLRTMMTRTYMILGRVFWMFTVFNLIWFIYNIWKDIIYNKIIISEGKVAMNRLVGK